jgi:hypothetical protein
MEDDSEQWVLNLEVGNYNLCKVTILSFTGKNRKTTELSKVSSLAEFYTKYLVNVLHQPAQE